VIYRRSVPRRRTAKRIRKIKATRKLADRLFSQLIRDRDGNCCRECGSTYVVQCAHLVSRRYAATRHCLDNAVALCRAHHMKWTHDPLGWEAWIEGRFPGRLAELKRRALAGVHAVDYSALVAELRAKGAR
jgi:hypothetical protein